MPRHVLPAPSSLSPPAICQSFHYAHCRSSADALSVGRSSAITSLNISIGSPAKSGITGLFTISPTVGSKDEFSHIATWQCVDNFRLVVTANIAVTPSEEAFILIGVLRGTA